MAFVISAAVELLTPLFGSRRLDVLDGMVPHPGPQGPVGISRDGETMTLPWITMLWGHVERWAERQVAGRFPFARITIWGLFAAFVLTTFPNYSQINRMFKGEGNIWFWAAIAEKRNDLFKDMLKAYPPGYHESQGGGKRDGSDFAKFQ